jgi:hypothetical protein
MAAAPAVGEPAVRRAGQKRQQHSGGTEQGHRIIIRPQARPGPRAVVILHVAVMPQLAP